jgi:hypothetical protein
MQVSQTLNDFANSYYNLVGDRALDRLMEVCRLQGFALESFLLSL